MPRRLRLAPVLAALAASLSLGTALTHAAPAPFAQPAVPSPDEMDKLTGPIALYPDALVAQILLCAESPYQVTQVNTWVKANAALKGTEAQEAAEKQGFDASFIALVPFPQVLEMMASQHDWTTKLGQAFAADKDAVFNSIQRLRAKAKAVGNLQTTPQQEVVTQQASGGQQVIVIQPANPQVVYVPVYSTTTVYTQPAPTSSQTAGAAIVGFTAGVIVGAAIANNNHYSYGWGYHGGCCYSGGWNNYTDYRSDMANDRQNAVNSNQSQRQSTSSANQAQRQDTSSANQAARQDSKANSQASRQDQQNSNQANRDSKQSANQATRDSNQSTRSSQQSANQSSRQSASSQASGSKSGGMGTYQSGSQTRSASSRGQSSLSSRSSGGRSSGGRSGGRR